MSISSVSLPQKRKISTVEFDNGLSCPICLEIFTAPIVLCNKGHSFCSAWVEENKRYRRREWAVCRSEISMEQRNFSLEEIVNKLEIPCKYRRHGCRESGPRREIQIHQSHCKFQPIKWNYSGKTQRCKWTGSVSKLAEHLIAHHQTQIIRSINQGYFYMTQLELYREYFTADLVINDSNYLFESQYSTQRQMCTMTVRGYHDSIGKIASINLESPDREATLELKTPIKNIVESKFLYETDDLTSVLHLPHEQVKMFLWIDGASRLFKLKITVS